MQPIVKSVPIELDVLRKKREKLARTREKDKEVRSSFFRRSKRE